MKKLFYFLIFLANSVFAQTPTLLKDINTVGFEIPQSYCKVGSIVFFVHDDNIHGKELWRTDGTGAGTYLVKDINPGYAGSFNYTNELIEFSGLLFFVATTPTNGTELWKSDGTEAGTVLVKDISSSILSSDPRLLTVCNSYLMFTANARTSPTTADGFELWRTDGTAAGTVVMSNISNGSDNGQIIDIEYAPMLFTDNVFFVQSDNLLAGNNGIWQTSQSCFIGCTAWSTPSIIAGTAGAFYLLFNFNSATSSFDLFFRNTTFGLSKYNLNNSTLTSLCSFSSYYSFLTLVAYNNAIYFIGYDATNGWELWKSDGTVAGTALFKNINNNPTNGALEVNDFKICNNELYFTATNGINGTELWKTNGTAAGTVMVNDIVPGVDSSYPYNLVVDGTKLFFLTSPTDPNYVKYQAWVFDAPTSQATLLKDFTPIPYIEDYLVGTVLNGTFIFTGYDATHGFEVWKSDGTVAGTAMMKDISAGGSLPVSFLSVNANTFFGAIEGFGGYKPYVSNGTTAGTFKLADILLYHDYAVPSTPFFTNVNGTVFFGATNATSGTELWKTNGTVAGTALVKDINPVTSPYVQSSSPYYFCNGNGNLYFSADDGVNGTELWKSDGTATGTVMVKDIASGSSSSYPKNLTWAEITIWAKSKLSLVIY